MKKSWGLTRKILTGEKKIESRWYKTKRAPFGKISSKDIIYFKDSGEPVKIKAEVKKIIEFSDLNYEKVKEILGIYGREDGIKKEETPKFIDLFKDKRYCILIYLKNAQNIEEFNINKKGFGNMTAWISVKNISQIKI